MNLAVNGSIKGNLGLHVYYTDKDVTKQTLKDG